MNVLAIIKQLSDRPISFHKAYVKLTGSVNAALMLSQAMYWTPRTTDTDGWFYKSSADWEEETGLGRHEQDTARKQLKKTGFWHEKLKGVPATTHYRIDLDRMASSLSDSGKLDCANPAYKNAGIQQTIITETTTETTSLTESKDSVSHKPEFITIELGFDKPSDGLPNTNARAKKPELPEYKDFIRIWDEKYHHIGLKMPRDGAKIKLLILETRRQLGLLPVPLEATTEHTIEFWRIFIENLHRTWGHGKDLAVIESKYPSLIFEMAKGKQVRITDQNSASMAFGKYGNLGR